MKKKIAAIAAATGLAVTAFAGVADAKGKPGPDSIVTIASENGSFNTLLAAVGCADPAVGAALANDDKLTVFAPTDDAFRTTLDVDASDVCDIDKDLLTTVLLYHVTDGRRFSNSVVPKGPQPKTIDTLAGLSFQVDGIDIIDGNDTTSPSIIAEPGFFDINASNGVIHVVDEVLLPINL